MNAKLHFQVGDVLREEFWTAQKTRRFASVRTVTKCFVTFWIMGTDTILRRKVHSVEGTIIIGGSGTSVWRMAN